MDGRVRGRIPAVTSPVSLIPLAAAVHGMSAPVSSGRRLDAAPADRRAHPPATHAVAGYSGAPGDAPRDERGTLDLAGADDAGRPLTLVEDTGPVTFNALPAETPATGHDRSPEPVPARPASAAPIEPRTAPATTIRQGASIPVGSIPGPTAGTASTPAWRSSSVSPRSA